MKRIFNGFFMSAGMFSIFPVPTVWLDSAMPLIIPFFPMVGLLIGVVWFLAVNCLMSYSDLLSVLSFLLLPFVLSGFIHLDGFMDTSDAVLSRRPLEEKKRILKDSHVGAFAVIMVVLLFVAQYSAISGMMGVITTENLTILMIIPVVSRSISGIFMLWKKPFSENGYATMFQMGVTTIHKAVLVLIAVVACFAGGFLGGVNAIIILSVMTITGVTSGWYLCREFGGISGDLCGYILVSSEAMGIITMAVTLGA